MRVFHLPHVQEFQRVLHLRAGRHEVEIGAFDAADALFERLFGQHEVGKAGTTSRTGTCCGSQGGEDRDRQSALASSSCAWASARLIAVKVLPSAGDALVTTIDMQILLALHVIQARAQAAEFLARYFMRPLDIDQMGFGRGMKRDGLAARKEVAPVDMNFLRFRAQHPVVGNQFRRGAERVSARNEVLFLGGPRRRRHHHNRDILNDCLSACEIANCRGMRTRGMSTGAVTSSNCSALRRASCTRLIERFPQS